VILRLRYNDSRERLGRGLYATLGKAVVLKYFTILLVDAVSGCRNAVNVNRYQ